MNSIVRLHLHRQCTMWEEVFCTQKGSFCTRLIITLSLLIGIMIALLREVIIVFTLTPQLVYYAHLWTATGWSKYTFNRYQWCDLFLA